MTDETLAAQAVEAPQPGPSREGPYGPIGPNAKVNPWWAAVLVAVGVMIVATLASIIGAVIALVIGLGAGLDASDENALIGILLIGALLTQFPAMALAALIWGKVIEKRSLASMGFTGGVLWKYPLGVVGGVLIAVTLLTATQIVAPALGVEVSTFTEGEPVWERLQSAQVYWIFGLLTAFFLMQGACEEIAFRGWMQSSLFARIGAAPAVILNAAVFGLVHFHFWMMEGATVGTIAVLTVTLVGVVFSLWALRERGIWGVCGAHGSYNATLVGVTIAILIAASEEGPFAALYSLIEIFSDTDGVPQTTLAEALFQVGAVSVFVCAALVIWLRRPRGGESGRP